MRSSRKRTARLFPYLPAYTSGAGVSAPGGGCLVLGGSVCSWGGVWSPGGLCSWGVSAFGPGGVSGPRGGVCLWSRGVYPSMQWGRQPHLWTERRL